MADFAIMLNGKQEENYFHHDPFEVIITHLTYDAYLSPHTVINVGNEI